MMNVIGNGVVVNLPGLFKELKQLDDKGINYDGRLVISNRAHIVTTMQLEADAQAETDASSII